jgi:23S rRNA pseudouridine955/2504/2580 synthase
VPVETIQIAGKTPKKLANVLKQRFPKGYVRTLFRKRGVRINGKRGRPEDTVQAGDEIELFIPFDKRSPPALHSAPELKVVFEDADIIIIDKPAGYAVHEGKTILKRNSILGVLESRYRKEGIMPKLVHRLDRDTSGILILAKNEAIREYLEDSFRRGRVAKEYFCLVAGRLQPNHGELDSPLPGRKGVEVRAVTRFSVLKKFADTTFVRVWIDTGRMHQIRLHFSQLGYPVVLDDQHGDFRFNRDFRQRYGLRRQFLHAASISFQYRGKERTFSAPLPEDLRRTLDALNSLTHG